MVAVGAVALVGIFALPVAQTACTGNDCLGDVQSWGSCAEGEALDANTWESGPLTGTYLDFHGEREWVFDPTPWMGTREPDNVFAYISFSSTPTADGGEGFAPPAGNLFEITPVKTPSGYKVQALNDTCAQYYLRVVVTYPMTKDASATPVCMGDAGP